MLPPAHRGVYQLRFRLAKSVVSADLPKPKGAMGYKDVRQWIQKVDEMGELKIVENADWHSETLSVLSFKHRENTLASMFDHIRDSLAG
jgi:hypothetical protein